MARIEIAREDYGKPDALAKAVDRASRKSAIERAVAAERERCAILVGAWPTYNYGSFNERLKVQQATVDMAAAIRKG